MHHFRFFKIHKKVSLALVLMGVTLWTFSMNPVQASSDPVQTSKRDSKLIRVLVIEGGGIRGILSTKILEEIEHRAECPISDLFDVMMGSSTGSIQVALLNSCLPHTRKPAYNTQDILHFYEIYGAKILTPSLWRRVWTLDGFIAPLLSHKHIAHYVEKLLGDRKLNESLTTVFIPSYDLNTTDVILFSSRDPINGQMPLKDIVLASTSIPNIFPSFPWHFSDGIHYLTDALFADNDPIQSALIYTDQLYPNNPKLLLSLGSGYISTQTPPKSSRYQGLLHALPIWMRMIFSGNDDKLNSLMEEIRIRKGFGLEFYFRLNPRILESEADPLDASPQNIKDLQQTAEDYIREHSEEIDKIVEILQTHK